MQENENQTATKGKSNNKNLRDAEREILKTLQSEKDNRGGTSVFSIRIDSQHLRELNSTAERLGVSRNALINYSIIQILKN